MTKCIICLQATNGNEEHIIPFSLGNKKYVIHDICSACNNQLGAKVDSWLIEHPYIRAIRNIYELSSQKGNIPQFLDVTFDKYGRKYLWDNNMHPHSTVTLRRKDNAIFVAANSEEELRESINKHLSRDDKLPPELRNFDSFTKKYGFHKMETTMHLKDHILKYKDNKLARETAIIKIAYEYTYERLKGDYLSDKVAVKIRNCLQRAKGGCYDYLHLPIRSMENQHGFKDYLAGIRNRRGFVHQLELERHKDMLVVSVYLFSLPMFSYMVVVSVNPDDYKPENISDRRFIYPKSGTIVKIKTDLT